MPERTIVIDDTSAHARFSGWFLGLTYDFHHLFASTLGAYPVGLGAAI